MEARRRERVTGIVCCACFLAAAVAGTAGCGVLQPDSGDLEGYRRTALYADSAGAIGVGFSDIVIDEVFDDGSPIE